MMGRPSGVTQAHVEIFAYEQVAVIEPALVCHCVCGLIYVVAAKRRFISL